MPPYLGSAPQMSSSQRCGVSDEELESVAAAVVRHMVFRHQSHPGIPVKREDLAEIAQKRHPHSRNLLAFVLPVAKRICKETLGLELIELGTTHAPASQSSQPSQPQSSQAASAAASRRVSAFVLKSALPPPVLAQFVLTPEAAQLASLRLTVCALIQGAGGRIPDEVMWRLLGTLGLRKGSTTHPCFGNVDEAMQQLVKERYIVSKKDVLDDGTEAQCYELGAQAIATIGEESLKTYYDTICETSN